MPYPPPSGEPANVPPPVGGPVPPAPPAAAYPPPAPPVAAHAAAPTPVPAYGEPPLGPPSYLDASVLPAVEPEPEPRRGRGRVAIAAGLAVLLVLVAGGAAYGWQLMHRPDVQVARAFSATTSAAQGDVVLTVEGADPSGGFSGVRYAWGSGTQQIQVRTKTGTAADVIVTPNHLTLRIDPSLFASQPEALAQLRTIAGTLGADGAALEALADGKPVGIAIGPGSPLQKLIDSLQSSAGSTSSSSISPDQISKITNAIQDAVKKNATVTDAGSDQYGDHYKVTVPLKPVAQAAMSSVASQLGPLAGKVSSADLKDLDGKTLTADVWTKDGRVVRVAVPLSDLSEGQTHATVVATFGTGGVQQSTEPVTEVSGGLLDKLLGGLGSLGDLGGFGSASGAGSGASLGG